MSDLSRVRMSGPLEPFASGFAVELSRQGYRPVSAAFQLQLMAHLSRWLAGEGLDGSALTGQRVELFLVARRAAGYTNYRSPRAMAPLLGYLRSLGVAPAVVAAVATTPVDELLARYRRYLALDRGLAAVTVRCYLDMVSPFLAARAGGRPPGHRATSPSNFHMTSTGRARASRLLQERVVGGQTDMRRY